MKYFFNKTINDLAMPTEQQSIDEGSINRMERILNISEKIAKQGGFLISDDRKETTAALLALSYAKERRESNISVLRCEIGKLDIAIKQLQA